jgi:hypothetical protein
MWLPNLLLILLCSIHLPGKYLLIKLSEKGKKQSCTQEVDFFSKLLGQQGWIGVRLGIVRLDLVRLGKFSLGKLR